MSAGYLSRGPHWRLIPGAQEDHLLRKVVSGVTFVMSLWEMPHLSPGTGFFPKSQLTYTSRHPKVRGCFLSVGGVSKDRCEARVQRSCGEWGLDIVRLIWNTRMIKNNNLFGRFARSTSCNRAHKNTGPRELSCLCYNVKFKISGFTFFSLLFNRSLFFPPNCTNLY